MRAVFGVVSLLVVVAIVGMVVARQGRALSVSTAAAPAQVGVTAPASTVPASVATPMTVRAQSQQLQAQVLGDIDKAQQQATRRLDDADK